MFQNMQGLDYLIVEPACEVNEKGTREKNDGNEKTSMGDNEKIEVHSDESSFAEEDRVEPDQNEVPEWIKPDKPIDVETRRGGRKNTSMRYNRYGDDFLIDKMKPDEVKADLVRMGDLVSGKEWQINDDDEHFWEEDHSVPERKMYLEQSQKENREHTILRILEWIHDLPDHENEKQSKQQVDVSAAKHVK